MIVHNMTGMESAENVTNIWHSWKLAEEKRLNSDLDKLQGEGIIPDDVHEHTMIAALTVVLMDLFFFILTIGIWKKFGFLKEQIRNALRNITP